MSPPPPKGGDSSRAVTHLSRGSARLPRVRRLARTRPEGGRARPPPAGDAHDRAGRGPVPHHRRRRRPGRWVGVRHRRGRRRDPSRRDTGRGGLVLRRRAGLRDPRLRGRPHRPAPARQGRAVSYIGAAVGMMLASVVLDLFVLRTRLLARLIWWLTYPIVLGFQLLSNGVLTSTGAVNYRPDTILGVRVFHAPVEDLGFGFALVLATLSVWMWRERRETVP